MNKDDGIIRSGTINDTLYIHIEIYQTLVHSTGGCCVFRTPHLQLHSNVECAIISRKY